MSDSPTLVRIVRVCAGASIVTCALAAFAMYKPIPRTSRAAMTEPNVNEARAVPKLDAADDEMVDNATRSPATARTP